MFFHRRESFMSFAVRDQRIFAGYDEIHEARSSFPAFDMTKVIRVVPFLLAFIAGSIFAPHARTQTIRVDITPDRVTNTFRPTEALGGAVDRIPLAATDKIFTEPMIKRILSAGWQTVTYRQNTELYVEAWHWNPKGKWTESDDKGYFVGDSTPTDFIRHSFGYPLPHQGFSRPDGTGYSRLTDGDTDTYWKSNPYLSKPFTGEEESLHPQWVVVDLAKPQDVNAIRIDWTDPYARRYQVQYWTGVDALREPTRGAWVTFPGGAITNGTGGPRTIQLSRAPMPARFIRIWMTESSNTCDTHGSGDRRNCLGYAIRELYIGTLTPDGAFHDVVRHTADRAQSNTICSSVDPWHEGSVINDRRDHVGFDLFYTSGITRGLPAMVPVAMIYDNPENAVAEIAYLEKRGYPISYVEMGEEPDGKHTLPEDYGAFYLEWATALHRLDPKLKLGGPIFEGVNKDIEVWPDAQGRTSWMARFFDYLKSHGRISDLSFVSFEHYPFQPCLLQRTRPSIHDGLSSGQNALTVRAMAPSAQLRFNNLSQQASELTGTRVLKGLIVLLSIKSTYFGKTSTGSKETSLATLAPLDFLGRGILRAARRNRTA